MKKIFLLCLLFSCILLTPESTMELAHADEISLVNGSKITGIIIKNDATSLTVETIGRKRTINKTEITNIDFADDKDNLYLMADFALNKNEDSKAFHLYSRILEIDPDSKKAAQSILQIQNRVFQKNNLGFLKNNDRFLTRSSSRTHTDKELLEQNAEQTDALLKDFGIVIVSVAGNLVIRQVTFNSRADAAKLAPGDILHKIKGVNVIFFGLYDLSSILERNKNKKIPIEILRDIAFSSSGALETQFLSVKKVTGFNLIENSKDLTVSKLEKNSHAYKHGVRDNDSVVAVNGVKVEKESDIIKHIRTTTTGQSIFTFKKKIAL